MKNPFLLLFFLLLTTNLIAQEATKVDEKSEKPPIDLYKIVSADRDTTYVDTSLSVKKLYKFNYLRRDQFELLPFSNVGQTYNSLAYDFDQLNLKPLFVAQSHHFNYMDSEDISYYNVPTPLTELYFKTAFEQGQQLDAFFTVNTNERFNFSVAYKGVRSLGIYQNILTSTGNFRFTTNYTNKSKRYKVRAHVVAQDILNEENGGLPANSIDLFVNDDPEFNDRGRIDVNFEDAENLLKGLRFYADHEYELIRQRDSTSYNVLAVGNRFSYEEKSFLYTQDAPFENYGNAYETTNLRTRTNLEDFNVQAYARLENSLLGTISAFAGYTDYNYGYNSVLILDEGRINNRLQGNLIQFGAGYKKQYRGFQLSGKGAINISGDYDANYLQGAASFSFNDDTKVEASATLHSVAPNFGFQLYQSDYVNYNWQNNFENVKTQELAFELQSEKFLNASVSYTGIDDYTYYTIQQNDSTPTPQQYGERVDYLKVKAQREFKYGKFALDNTLLFQQAVGGDEVFNVPQLVTRNTLYFQDELFKKALFLQTGVTFKYFTKYNMNGYDPVLAEFYVQNDQELGGFPLLDVFISGKIKQTRIFFKWEHFNQLFKSTNDQFSAPGYPYRDAVIRFGLVWNFFL